MSTDLCFSTAIELARRIRAREVSVTEVVQAHLAQIERVNPKVNAIVTLTAERALAEAREKDAALARGAAAGPLFGLPVAHKELVPTRGIRTTYGSPIYRDNVPDQDALLVERLKAAGAITFGKTNTPEFGAGSQTFNEVFGRTLLTSFATALSLVGLLVYGVGTIFDFSFAMLIGIVSGTYSTWFIAAPMTIWLEERAARKKAVGAHPAAAEAARASK